MLNHLLLVNIEISGFAPEVWDNNKAIKCYLCRFEFLMVVRITMQVGICLRVYT